MAHSGGVRKKKPKDILFSKTVILLKSDDQGYMSFSELSRIRSTPEQYKKGIEFASWMTEDDVTKKIKETFPYLENKRFSCAAVVKLDNDHKKYEYYGPPRVWNGETIKKKIIGNSSLYILEEVSQQTLTVTNNGSNSTADSNPSIHSLHPAGEQTCTINTPLDRSQVILYQQLDQLSSEFQQLGDQYSPMEVDDDNQQGVYGAPNSMQNAVYLNAQASSEQGHSSPLSRGEGNVTATCQQELHVIPASSIDNTDVIVAAAHGAQVEVSGKCSSSSEDNFSTSGISEGDLVLSEDDLSQDHWRREANVQFQVSITPNRVPLKGGELCNFTFTPLLPTNVQLGSAEFVHLETVRVKRFEDDSMIGKKIPPSPEPGWVTVILKSQYGIKLGETRIEYVDEEKEFLQRVVQEPKLQRRLFNKWATVLGDNSETKKTETQSSGNVGFTQMEQVRVLQLLVYAAAETRAQQFIQMIFNSSAGRVVFDAYKDSSPLPEVIARKHGHKETSQYLEGITTRFSKEMKICPEGSQTIDWAELEAAAEAAQEQHELRKYLNTGVSEGSMAQQHLQEKTVEYGVSPPLSIELPKKSDLRYMAKPWSDVHLPVDILLLTVEDCEFLACYAYMTNAFKSYHRDLGFIYFGNMGESEEEPLKVALMRCCEGSTGRGGSQTVPKNAVMQLRPKAIYSVGCCKGLDPEDTKLGDVVISSKLTTEAFKTPVGRDIANLIKNAADGWNPPLKSPKAQEVLVHRDGEILSGIDRASTERHRELNPNAIAETEGKGIFVAANDLKWVIVKGISHFANDINAPDESWKSHACVMAASLVSNMLSDPIVFKHWPHYGGIASIEENHQVESVQTIDTGYFGDAETSYSDSSQLSRSDSVDDDSELSFEGPEQGGVSGTSGTVAADVAGCSGASQQAHHDQEYLDARFLKEELFKVDSIKKILEMDRDFKCACESSGEAASEILGHLGMIAWKEGLTGYNVMEASSLLDLSREQRHFLTLCGQCFFCCRAEWRQDLFPAFLSSVRGVLLINSSQLHIIANEHLLKTNAALRCIFFTDDEYGKHPEEYNDLITIVEDLNAVVVSCSGEKNASEFLKKYKFRRVVEFFLKKEQNVHLYIAHIRKSFLVDFPTEMLKELIVAPESTATKNRKCNAVLSSEQENTTGLHLAKNSDSNSCSPHCLSMVWDIHADCVGRSEMEILTHILPLVVAPRVILVYGKYADAYDAQFPETLINKINFTNRLETLTLNNIKLTASCAAFIAKSLYKVPNLRCLDLSYNSLGEGVSFLTEHLGCVPHLEDLRLNGVMMTKKQVHDLTATVRQNKIYLQSDYHDGWGKKVYQDDLIPAHVQARGKKALAAYHRALKTGGSTYDKRVKVLVVGQDRVGKMSLCKSLRGEAFNENERSTDGLHIISSVKNAGTEAWRNPPSLEHTTVFDHKIAVEVTRELLSTSAEQPAREESSESPTEDVTGDKIQEPTRVACNETFHMTKENEHPMPSTADETKDLGFQHAHRQDAQHKTMARNQEQDRKNKKKPPYVAQEKIDSLPEECVSLLEEQLKRKEVDQDDKIWAVVWDFAGQDIYRAIHPIFMSSEDIYLLVSDLSKNLSAIAECRVNLGDNEDTVRACDCDDTNFDHILRWLDLIHSLEKGDQNEKSESTFLHPPVILVGTHADRVDDPRKEINILAKHCSKDHKVFAKHITKCFAIDNRQAGEKILALRNEILKQADKMPHTKKEIPLQWNRVEKEISKPTWQRKRYLRKKTFHKDIVSLYCTFDNEDPDFDELVHFLHGRGTIVYHEDTSDKDGLVILDLQWLIDVLCQIIKVKSHDDEPVFLVPDREELQEKGILSRELIDHACQNQKIDVIKDSLISLMEKFNLICKWPAAENEDSLILVPCMLTSKGEREIAMDDMTGVCPAPMYLKFNETGYVPCGLFCRLVVLFGKWLSDPQYTNEYELHANEARFALDNNHLLHLVCYKRVIKLHISTKVDYTPPEHYKNVFSHLKKFLETLKKDCHWLRSMSEELCARCTMCLGAKSEPCARHEERSCRHHDCSHYISLKTKLCCKPGCPLPLKPLQPWIRVNEEMNLFTSRDTAQSHPGQSGVEKSTKRPASEVGAIAQAMRNVQLTHSNIKDGVVADDDLEGLSLELGTTWDAVARRLEFSNGEITAFHKENEEYTRKALSMLQRWKEKYGSEATYQVLHDALCHEFVNRKDLAEEFCTLDC